MKEPSYVWRGVKEPQEDCEAVERAGGCREEPGVEFGFRFHFGSCLDESERVLVRAHAGSVWGLLCWSDFF